MTEGYAVYSATLGHRGFHGEPYDPENDCCCGSHHVSLLIALDSETPTPLTPPGDLARDLDVATAVLVGALNLSRLRWATFTGKPPVHYLLDDGTNVAFIEGEL